MAGKLNVVTGATGLLGSHIVESLIERGERVRALVRPTSDVAFLRSLGVELTIGDLHDPESLRRAIGGADIVYHCAARVGDWGKWSLYRCEIIDATRNLLDTCRSVGVGRVLYVSSVTVYGHPRDTGESITEDAPQGRRLYWFWDYYCRSKIAAEAHVRAAGANVTIVRPSWIYGPRDRNSLPRLMAAFRAGRVRLIGSGENLLNVLYAADVADGAIRAANHPHAGGRAYNLCSEGELTQRQFLDALTEVLGQPPVRRHVPFWFAYSGGFISELIGRMIFLKRPPYITRYAVGLVGRLMRFSIALARDELGWQPRIGAHEGLRRTLDWWKRDNNSRLRLSANAKPQAAGLEVLRWIGRPTLTLSPPPRSCAATCARRRSTNGRPCRSCSAAVSSSSTKTTRRRRPSRCAAALNLVSRLPDEQKRRGIIGCTTGNHGQSLAYACRCFGVRCVLVVPAVNNPDKIAAMRRSAPN